MNGPDCDNCEDRGFHHGEGCTACMDAWRNRNTYVGEEEPDPELVAYEQGMI